MSKLGRRHVTAHHEMPIHTLIRAESDFEMSVYVRLKLYRSNGDGLPLNFVTHRTSLVQ